MITKEQFVKHMSLIQNFHSEQDTLSALINKLTGEHSVVIIGNYLADSLVDIIEDDLGIMKDDWLTWWLYEDVEKVIYEGDREISVRTLEELYDYLVNV